jgi:hypothetical protein
MCVNLYYKLVYEFILIYDWQTQKKTRFEKKASPLSPGMQEFVPLVEKD